MFFFPLMLPGSMLARTVLSCLCLIFFPLTFDCSYTYTSINFILLKVLYRSNNNNFPRNLAYPLPRFLGLCLHAPPVSCPACVCVTFFSFALD